MNKNIDWEETYSQYYKQFVNTYEIVESGEEDGSIEYTFRHKKTSERYITLNYSALESLIEIRLLVIKAICLIKTNNRKSLTDFINFPADELSDYIHYLDIQGNPSFYYSEKLSNKKQTVMDIAADEQLQVKFIAIMSEVHLALHFSGLLYQKHYAGEL